MTDDLPAIIDLVARGGTAMVLLLTGALLLRDHGRSASARLGAAFALGTAAYAICSAPGIHARLGLWAIPIAAVAAGNNVAFWLFVRAIFDDRFRPRPWHGPLWLGLAGLGVVEAWTASGSLALTLAAIGFAGLATAQTLATWREDLVEGRRRLRVFIAAAASGYVVLNALANLLGTTRAAPEATGLVQAVGLAAIAGTVAWSLLRVGGGEALFVPAPAHKPAADPAPDPAAARVERIVIAERLHRDPDLTIGALAQRLGLPEYRLRRLINGGLGHRNFSEFLNFYRIAEAKAALADPAQAGVPVLTIALDSGFGSLGPFNRAFKAATGMTPTAFRRAGAADQKPPFEESAGRISISA